MRLQVRIDGIARKLREIRRQTQAFTDEIEVVDGFGQDTPLRRDPSVTRPTARCRWATPPSGPKEWPPNERIWPARQPGLPPGSRLADRAYGGFREDGAAHPLTGCKSARRAAAPVPALRGRSSGRARGHGKRQVQLPSAPSTRAGAPFASIRLATNCAAANWTMSAFAQTPAGERQHNSPTISNRKEESRGEFVVGVRSVLENPRVGTSEPRYRFSDPSRARGRPE